MLGNFGRKKLSVLDEPIADVLTNMNKHGEETEEYNRSIDHLERLMKMKTEERRDRVSPDTMAIVGGNLLGILIMVAYEQRHVIGDKTMRMILQTRNPR